MYARANDYRDLAAKIVELLDDEPRRRRMGEIALQRMVDELEWRHQEPKLLAAYEQAMRGYRRRTSACCKASVNPGGGDSSGRS